MDGKRIEKLYLYSTKKKISKQGLLYTLLAKIWLLIELMNLLFWHPFLFDPLKIYSAIEMQEFYHKNSKRMKKATLQLYINTYIYILDNKIM